MTRADGPIVRPHEFVGFFFEPDPLLGWKMKPGRSARFSKPGIDTWVRINPFGFRGPDVAQQKPADSLRIMILGDSFGVAIEVEESQIFSHVLGEALDHEQTVNNPVEVINASVGGYGTEQQLLYLLTEGKSFDPDILLVAFHYGDDIIENSPRLRQDIHWRLVKLPRPSIEFEGEMDRFRVGPYPAEKQVRRSWQRYWDYLPREHFALVEHDVELAKGSAPGRGFRRSIDTLTTRWRKVTRARTVPLDLEIFRRDLIPAYESAWVHTARLLKALQAHAVEAGALLIVAGICTKEQVVPMYLENRLKKAGEPMAKFDPDAPNRRLASVTGALAMPFLDLTGIFRKHSKDKNLFYEHDLHWNPDGHRLAGRELANFIHTESGRSAARSRNSKT